MTLVSAMIFFFLCLDFCFLNVQDWQYDCTQKHKTAPNASWSLVKAAEQISSMEEDVWGKLHLAPSPCPTTKPTRDSGAR